MPFKSKAQERAAFGGYLGPEMKKDAKEWASKTDQKKLPNHITKTKALEHMKSGAKKHGMRVKGSDKMTYLGK